MLRRRLHLTRTTVGFLIAVVFWLMAAVAAVRAMSHPRVRAWLAQRVSVELSAVLKQRIRVADAAIHLYPPRLSLNGVEVGEREAPLLVCASAEVGLGRIRVAEREVELSHLRLRGLRVSGRLPEATGAGREPWLRVAVRQLTLEDVQIARLELARHVVLAARDLDLRWSGSSQHPVMSAVVSVGGFAVRARGMEPFEGSLMAWGKAADDGFEIRRVRGAGKGWEVDARGFFRAGTLTAEGSVAAELMELDRVVRARAGMEGRAFVHFRAEVAGMSYRVDASVLAEKIAVSGFAFEDLAGEAHLSPEGLEASLERASFAGGLFEGSYALEELSHPWRHHLAVRGQDVSLDGFLATLGVPEAGLAGAFAVSADLSWAGSGIREGQGTAVAQLSPVAGELPVSGEAIVSLAGRGSLEIAARAIEIAGARVRWRGSLSLGTWRPDWHIQGEGVPVWVVAHLLEGWIGSPVIPAELQGGAALDVRLRGPFDDLSVRGMAVVAPVTYGSVEADVAQASFLVSDGILTLEEGIALVDSGRVAGKGELRFAADGQLDFALEGSGVPLARALPWVGLEAPFDGEIGGTAVLSGTLAAPAVSASLDLRNVALAGVPLGDGSTRLTLRDDVVTIADLAVGPLSAEVAIDLAGQQATVEAELAGFGLEGISPPLARLVGGALDCTFRGSFPFASPAGRLSIATRTGAVGEAIMDRGSLRVAVQRPGVWRLGANLKQVESGFGGRVEVEVESLHRLAEDLLAQDLPFDGEVEGDVELVIRPGQATHLDGALSRVVVEVEGETASLREPARLVMDGSELRLLGAELVGPNGGLFFRGERRKDGTISGNVAGEFPAALAALLWREADPRGRVELLGEILGTDTAPRFEGIARVIDGSIQVPGLPAPLANLDGFVEILPEALAISDMRYSFLGGGGTCNGHVVLDPEIELDLALRGAGVRWQVATGLLPSLTGDLRLVGPLDNLSLTGDLTLQRTLYRREISLRTLVREAYPPTERRTLVERSPIALNIRVAVPGTLEVETPLARLAARGDLRVVGDTNRPGLVGRLEVLPGAEVELAGVRYELDHGTVTFNAADRIEPFLDLLARATVQTWEVSVGLVGTLDRLTPTFASNPPLPEMDIVALISMGRRASEVGEVMASTVASSFLTDQLTGAVTRRARTLLDVDQLRVDPVVTTQGGTPTARLTVAKQLSRDWTVTVSTNLTSNREEVVVSRWRLSTGTYLEATRDSDGSYSLEVKWQRRY